MMTIDLTILSSASGRLNDQVGMPRIEAATPGHWHVKEQSALKIA